MNVMSEKKAGVGEATPAKQLRNSGIDLLRILGMIGIVATHSFADYDSARMVLYPWQVPLFFLLSGYFWKPHDTPITEIHKRVRTLLIPYLSWLIFFLVLIIGHALIIGRGFPTADVLNALRGGGYAKTPFTIFWFVSALFFARIYTKLSQYYGGNLLVSVMAILGLLTSFLIPNILGILWWSIGLSLACIPFVCFGIFLRNSTLKLSVRELGLIGTLVFVIGFATFYFGARPLDIKNSDFGTPVISILASCLLCSGLIIVFDLVFAQTLVAPVTHIARLSMPVMFVHPLILMVLKQFGHATWWGFLITLLISYAIAFVVNHVKLLHVVFG